MTSSHLIITIPKPIAEATHDAQLIALAHKFRQFRLYALQEAPGAFASTYDEEAGRGLDQTLDRLKSAKATQFVALKDKTAMQANHVHEAGVNALLDSDWLGFIVLIDLHECAESVSAESNPFDQIANLNRQSHDAEESRPRRYHLNGMFVHPSARRSGIGKRLIHAALNRARAESAACDRGFACTIIVDEWNDSARSLYARCGFGVVAKETYGEDRVAFRMELQEAHMRQRE